MIKRNLFQGWVGVTSNVDPRDKFGEQKDCLLTARFNTADANHAYVVNRGVGHQQL